MIAKKETAKPAARPAESAIEVSIVALRLAIANNAVLTGLVGHGPSQANRDVPLRLTTEQSKSVYEAIIAALTALKG